MGRGMINKIDCNLKGNYISQTKNERKRKIDIKKLKEREIEKEKIEMLRVIPHIYLRNWYGGKTTMRQDVYKQGNNETGLKTQQKTTENTGSYT